MAVEEPKADIVEELRDKENTIMSVMQLEGILGRAADEIERLRKIEAAAKLYAAWAAKGDYPHDEEGCEAHDAIVAAVGGL